MSFGSSSWWSLAASLATASPVINTIYPLPARDPGGIILGPWHRFWDLFRLWCPVWMFNDLRFARLWLFNPPPILFFRFFFDRHCCIQYLVFNSNMRGQEGMNDRSWRSYLILTSFTALFLFFCRTISCYQPMYGTCWRSKMITEPGFKMVVESVLNLPWRGL